MSKIQVTKTKSSGCQFDMEALQELEKCETGTKARQVLVKALNAGVENGINKPLFGSVTIPAGASDRSISDGDLAIQTKIRNKKYGVFDLIDMKGDRDADRASAAVLSVFIGSSLSAVAANENLPGPEIVRFTVVWLLSFAPLALVGFGIASSSRLLAVLVLVQRQIFPTYSKRMVIHEAGHFLLAHLLGYPIAGYTANAVKNAVQLYPLNDRDVGTERAQALGFDKPTSSVPKDDFDLSSIPPIDVPFFSKEGRGSVALENQSVFRNRKNYTEFLKISPRNDVKQSWPYRGFDHSTVDKLSVISVAGVCAEILSFGYAEGGVADFSQLESVFKSAEPELTEKDIENRIRFSISFTMTQLRIHLGVLDQLAETMEKGGSIAECVATIESCPNVNGNDGIFEEYEIRRRRKFKSTGFGFLERYLLNGKNVDDEEDRMVQGAGGGYRRESIGGLLKLSGDDPIYLALGVSFIFLAWASNGGLSLH
jgi:hypothetical protein